MAHRLVELNDAALAALASRREAVEALGGLLAPVRDAHRRAADPHCPKCQRGRHAAALRLACDAARQGVLALGDDQKRRLKALLDAEQIRLTVRSRGGRTATVYTIK